MSIERTVPFRDGMELGLGMDDLTGQVGSLDAVSYTESGSPAADSGMEATYDTSLINSAEQLYSQLNVDVAAEGRYGLFSGEGKFAFAENSRFSSTATFLVARARVQTAFVRVKNPVPVPDAQALVRDGKQDKFRQRYGDLFIRGIKSGGEFVAVLSITSSVKSEERELAVSLKASFDGVVAGGSVDSSVHSRQEELRSRSDVRVSIYQRGGSGDEISYVGTVDEVMARLKGFAKSVQEHPKAYTVQAASYDTLVFDDEPNWFDLARAREVLEDAMRKRVVLQTARNDVEAVLTHPSYFLAPPPAAVLNAWSSTITDTLNRLDDHISKVVDSISEAEFFSLTLPEGFAVPPRVEHSTLIAEVFNHADYAAEWQGIPGRSQKLPIGRYDDAKGQLLVGNDQISAVKVPEGLVVRGYEHAWFQGAFIDFTQDTPAVPMDWNDRISSLIVFEATAQPPVIDYAVGLDFLWGGFLLLPVGEYPDLGSTELGADTLSALLVPRGVKVTLFEDPQFGGASRDVRSDTLDLAEWNNRASSLKVTLI